MNRLMAICAALSTALIAFPATSVHAVSRHCPDFTEYSELISSASDTFVTMDKVGEADARRLRDKAGNLDTTPIKTQLKRMQLEPSQHFLRMVGLIADLYSVADIQLSRGQTSALEEVRQREIGARLREARSFLDKYCGKAMGSSDGISSMLILVRDTVLTPANLAGPKASFESTSSLAIVLSALLGLIGLILMVQYLNRLFWASVLVRRSCDIPATVHFTSQKLNGRVYTFGIRGCAVKFTQKTDVDMALHLQTNQAVKIVIGDETILAKYTRPIQAGENSGGFRFYSDLDRTKLNKILAMSESQVRVQLKRRSRA